MSFDIKVYGNAKYTTKYGIIDHEYAIQVDDKAVIYCTTPELIKKLTTKLQEMKNQMLKLAKKNDKDLHSSFCHYFVESLPRSKFPPGEATTYISSEYNWIGWDKLGSVKFLSGTLQYYPFGVGHINIHEFY